MGAFLPAYSDLEVSWAVTGIVRWVAPTEEAAEHPDKADAVLKSAGTFMDCYYLRGDILEVRGDWLAMLKQAKSSINRRPTSREARMAGPAASECCSSTRCWFPRMSRKFVVTHGH